MSEKGRETRKKIYFAVALCLALVLSTGAFAYTYGAVLATMGLSPKGEIATTATPGGQPDWQSIVPVGGGGAQEVLRPNAPGDTTDILYQQPASGAHWDKVDEAAADDWTTYVYTTAGYKRDLYNLSNSTETSSTIGSVTAYIRVAAMSPSKDAKAKVVIKTNGVAYEGPEETAGNAFETKSFQWLVNPQTNAAWTWDEVNSLQAGADIRKGSADPALTQVYVVVDYSETPVVTGNVPTGNLFTVTRATDFTGDIGINVYLLNSGDLAKAYRYLNIKVEVPGSVEGTFRMLSLETGVVSFKVQGIGGPYTVRVTGGSYGLVSGDPTQWEAGWTAVPELYIEVIQR